MTSKRLSKNNANQRKGGFKMKARKINQLAGGLIFILNQWKHQQHYDSSLKR